MTSNPFLFCNVINIVSDLQFLKVVLTTNGKIAYIVGGGRVQYQTDTYRKLVSAKLIVLGVSVISFT
jgi:hypothetical protein